MGRESIIADIGINTSDIEAGLTRVQSKMTATQKASDGLNSSLAGGKGGSNSYKLGQGAMQLQDFTIQMQNATDKTKAFFTATAQQAPQFLSIFGPAGAIAGGVVAMAAAIGSAVYNSQKNFSELAKTADESAKSFEGLAQSGSVTQLVSGIGKASDEVGKLNQEITDYTSGFSGYMATVGTIFANAFGGDSAEERIDKMGEVQGRVLMSQMKMRQSLLKLSEGEIEVAKLRINGENEAADKLEREIELKHKIAEINAGLLDDHVKEKLIAAETVKAQAKEAAIIAEKSKEKNKQIQSEDESVKAAQQSVALAQAELNTEKEQAEQLKRNIELEEKLRQIRISGVTEYTKQKLIEAAVSEKAAKDQKAAADAAKKAADDSKKHVQEIEDINAGLARMVSDREEEKKNDAEKQRKEEEDAQNAAIDAADRLTQSQLRQRPLKEQIAKQSENVKKAEQGLAKEAANSLGFFQKQKQLIEEIEKLQSLQNTRAGAYAQGSAAGRRFDRQQAKEAKELQKGMQRMNKQDRKAKGAQIAGAQAQGVPQINGPQGVPQNNVIPAGQQMQVQTLLVKELKHA
jgi:hypothetical protein